MKPSKGAWRECRLGGGGGIGLSQLVLGTLREWRRTAWQQTLGKAAEKRMLERRGNEDVVAEHSYPYK